LVNCAIYLIIFLAIWLLIRETFAACGLACCTCPPIDGDL